jgi:hypothetical protein
MRRNSRRPHKGEPAIAKAVITSCDVCGEASEDVQTWTLRQDGQTWEVDIDQKTDKAHSLPLSKLVLLGRATETSSRRGGDNKFLERRIRNTPKE